MSKVWIGLSLAALALAGCTPQAENAVDNAAAGNVTLPPDENGAVEIGNDGQPENALAAILAAPDYQRDTAFVRAIMDAGFRCDGVLKSERVADVQGLPAWRADCKDGKSHVLSVKPDGTVLVMSRAD